MKTAHIVAVVLVAVSLQGWVALARADDPIAAIKAKLAALPKPDEIKPLPLVAIPDDPPPHEGASFDLPYVIEPPDLLEIDVLEALPGKPISGDHLVRPDGTVSIRYYGDVHVRGLTLDQAKTKIVLHLRSYLNAETLGLVMEVADDDTSSLFPPNGIPPLTVGKDPRPSPKSETPDPKEPTKTAEENKPAQPTPEDGVNALPNDPRRRPPEPSVDIRVVAPKDSGRVSVDVSAYNSKYYYVQGDFANNGKYPVTGHDTVLDAIHYAGGFLPTADLTNLRLVRPARGGKPARVYRIAYKSIVEDGDQRANLQLFPGDRLIVSRAVAADKLEPTQSDPKPASDNPVTARNDPVPAVDAPVLSNR